MSIEVGTPVARCPPRRSRRAELPHRAPQENTQESAHGTSADTKCQKPAPFASRELDTVVGGRDLVPWRWPRSDIACICHSSLFYIAVTVIDLSPAFHSV